MTTLIQHKVNKAVSFMNRVDNYTQYAHLPFSSCVAVNSPTRNSTITYTPFLRQYTFTRTQLYKALIDDGIESLDIARCF